MPPAQGLARPVELASLPLAEKPARSAVEAGPEQPEEESARAALAPALLMAEGPPEEQPEPKEPRAGALVTAAVARTAGCSAERQVRPGPLMRRGSWSCRVGRSREFRSSLRARAREGR